MALPNPQFVKKMWGSAEESSTYDDIVGTNNSSSIVVVKSTFSGESSSVLCGITLLGDILLYFLAELATWLISRQA